MQEKEIQKEKKKKGNKRERERERDDGVLKLFLLGLTVASFLLH